MSDSQTIDDALLYAWIDGELDPAGAARVAAAVATDPALATRAATQRVLRARLQGGFAAILDEPVPAQLLAVIAAPSAAVVDLGKVRAQRDTPAPVRRWALPQWSAIAATLLLGTLLGALAFRAPGSLPLQSVDGRLVARAELDAALSAQLTGTATEDAAARIGLSFRTADGAYCRTFKLRSGAAGLACRRQGHWAVQVLDDSGPVGTETAGRYQQAGSALSPAMLGAIDALGASEALTREQEQQLLRTGWDSAAP